MQTSRQTFPADERPKRGNPVLFIAPEGWPFILPFLAAMVILMLLGSWSLAAVAGALTLAMAGFFRDPPRRIPDGSGIVVAPADGKVVEIVEEYEHHYLQQTVRRISIFLSVFNVHVNRAPLAGRVAVTQRQPGRFVPAYKPCASEKNEQHHLVLESSAGPILVKQIVGVLARRIVCRVNKGATLETGERFGLIRFGSRVDVLLPLEAHVEIKVGQAVKGGRTILARF